MIDMKSVKAISLLVCLVLVFSLCGCMQRTAEKTSGLGNGTEPTGSMELSYAKEFSVDYYEDGCRLLSVNDDSRFLIVPEGVPTPSGISDDIVVLQQPIENIYLVAAAAMSLIDSVGGLEQVRLSGTQQDKWYNENVRNAMERGDILFAGKYSEPDYELILNSDCSLAIESTMIYHTPEVREKLETLNIPVFVERSARESHPLGRTEWIKAYGVLLGKEDEAERIFSSQKDLMNKAVSGKKTDSTVAFFHISTSGYAVARKSGDYVAKMIDLAGGKYIFSDLGDSETATATTALEMETFYATAKDADYVIYNTTIAGELKTLDEFLAINSLLKNFKAVQNGNVWCTDQNLYQETTELGSMVFEMNQILTSESPENLKLKYFYRLK